MENGAAPAVGDRQFEEQGLEVELGVAETDIALAADRAAVADHAIDLQAALHSIGPYPSAKAQRQPVIGKGGWMQTIAKAERRGVTARVFVGIRGRLIPETADVPINRLGPLGLQEALQGQCRATPLGSRRIRAGRRYGRRASRQNRATEKPGGE